MEAAGTRDYTEAWKMQTKSVDSILSERLRDSNKAM
jgi:hypothetical protein